MPSRKRLEEAEKFASLLTDCMPNNSVCTSMDVVLDDRPEKEVSFGSKMKEAMLIGYPHIFILGKREKAGVVEVKDRLTGETSLMSSNEAAALLMAA